MIGIVGYVASIWWVDALEPAADVSSSLTVETTPGWLLFGLALIVGALRGARIAWAILLVFNAMFAAVTLAGALDQGSAQAIGGSILATIALVGLVVPSTQRFERRRLRLVPE